MDALLVFGLFGLTAALERLEARPFVATRMGWLLGVALGGRPLSYSATASITASATASANVPYRLLEVAWLPGVGMRPAGQTWGELVLVVRGQASARLLAHELCHVRQFRRLTSFGLWAYYLAQWLAGLVRHRDLYLAYWTMGLEVEARAAEGCPP